MIWERGFFGQDGESDDSCHFFYHFVLCHVFFAKVRFLLQTALDDTSVWPIVCPVLVWPCCFVRWGFLDVCCFLEKREGGGFDMSIDQVDGKWRKQKTFGS